MKRLLFLLLIVIVGLSSEALAKPFILTGRMNYIAELEGGCWYLDAENGERYQLVGTQEQLDQVRVIGRNVKLEVDPEPKMGSICMIGQMVRIIRVIDQVGYPVDKAYVTVKTSGRIYKTKAGCWYLKTSKGKKYDLDLDNIPKNKRKRGAKVNQHFRLFIDKSASECGFDGKALFVKDPATIGKQQRAKEKPRADPR
jgi:hypothetical protein